MPKVRRKAVAIKKILSNRPQQPHEETIAGKKIIWRFERVKLPYKSSVPRQIEIEGDALLEQRRA